MEKNIENLMVKDMEVMRSLLIEVAETMGVVPGVKVIGHTKTEKE